MDQPSSLLWRPARQGITTLLAAGLLLLNGGCGLIRWPGTGLQAPMPIPSPLRKQVLQGFMPFGSIAWVNNEQVVFHGVPVGSQQKTALYLWDLKRQPRLLLEHSPGGCVTEGTIKATQLSDKGESRMYSLSGPDYLPRQLPIPRLPARSVFEPVSCTSLAIPMALVGRKWQALRKGQGFLDFGPDTGPPSERKIEHLNAGLSTRHDTGIRMLRPTLPRAGYAAYDNSYLVYDINVGPEVLSRWISGGRLRIWRLDSQFRGEAMDVPSGDWIDEDIGFHSSRAGLLVASNDFARNGDPVGAGLYLIRQGSQGQRLERGFVEKLALSPDGCRLAYGFRLRLDIGIPEGGPRLVVIDLCGASAHSR